MNTQKYVISSLAAAVVLFLYGFLMWGLLLADYLSGLAPQGVLLPEASQNMMYIALGCLIQGFGLGLIYVRGHEGKGFMEGIRFGLYVGIFVLGAYVLMTGVSEYTLRANITYAIVDTGMYMLAGIAFALLYKK